MLNQTRQMLPLVEGGFQAGIPRTGLMAVMKPSCSYCYGLTEAFSLQALKFLFHLSLQRGWQGGDLFGCKFIFILLLKHFSEFSGMPDCRCKWEMQLTSGVLPLTLQCSTVFFIFWSSKACGRPEFRDIGRSIIEALGRSWLNNGYRFKMLQCKSFKTQWKKKRDQNIRKSVPFLGHRQKFFSF